jgi:RNA polymerase sigma-70 factor (ECF subfamily)
LSTVLAAGQAYHRRFLSSRAPLTELGQSAVATGEDCITPAHESANALVRLTEGSQFTTGRLPTRPGVARPRDARASKTIGHVDPAIIARFLAGDESAFAPVFRAYYSPLCHFVVQVFKLDMDDAEDVCHDVFVRLWRRLDRLPAQVTLDACLFQMTRTEALERIRGYQRRGRLLAQRPAADFTRSAPSPEDAAQQNDLLRIIRAAVERLPERCRRAFVLRRAHGFTTREVADELGVTCRTAETHVRHADKRIRAQLNDANII